MANKDTCWQAASTHTAAEANTKATFVPSVSVDMWQVRVINAHGSERNITCNSIDEDGEKVAIDLDPSAITGGTGEEYTIETKNPKLELIVAEASANVTIKVKAWSKYNSTSKGQPYAETAATAAGVTLTGDDTPNSF